MNTTLDERREQVLKEWVRQKPDATLEELAGRMRQEEKLSVSQSTLSRVLRKLGLGRKKKSFVAAERNEPEREELRQAASGPTGADMVFVDEMGINVDLARRYGRARPGERVVDKRPVNTPASTSVIGALGAHGMVVCLCVEGAVDGVCFGLFVEEMLVPQLRPGQIVLMDNVATHKSERVARSIESAGAALVYLPAYAPDFNPIEECWSKIKEKLRAAAARNRSRLMQALRAALAAITQQDILGWFQHAGYNFTLE